MRAQLYSILDTYTGQTIGEKLRVGEASKLIGLNMSHVPTYAKSGAKYKRRYVITATEEVRSGGYRAWQKPGGCIMADT